MVKKLLIYILCLLPFAMSASDANWLKYPVFRYTVDDMVQTSDRVYVLSGGNLHAYDPARGAFTRFDHITPLNGTEVSSIWYDPASDCVAVAYSDANIDILCPGGNIVNLPDIHDAEMTHKKINYISFAGNRMVVATSFGVVIYNTDTYTVAESGIYDCDIDAAVIMGGNLVIHAKKFTKDPDLKDRYPDYSIMFAPLSGRINNLSRFRRIGGSNLDVMEPINDSYLLYRDAGDKRLLYRRMDFNTPFIHGSEYDGRYKTSDKVHRHRDGFYTTQGDKLIRIDSKGMSEQQLPASLDFAQLAFYGEPKRIWTGSDRGLSCYDINGTTAVSVVEDALPNGFTTCQDVANLHWSADGRRLYASNRPHSLSRPNRLPETNYERQTANVITTSAITDISLPVASADHIVSSSRQNAMQTKHMYAGMQDAVEDPDNPDRYYITNYFEGLYVAQRNAETGVYEEIGKFNHLNSPIDWDEYSDRVMRVDFDRQGNMWVGHELGNMLSVLPADKRLKDPKSLTAADWYSNPGIGNLSPHSRDMTLLACKQSDYVIYSTNSYKAGFLVVVNTSGTADTSDDTVTLIENFTDQDGKKIMVDMVKALAEDHDGNIWIGASNCAFMMENPSKAANGEFSFIRPVLDDSHNLLNNYLLDSESITWISVDRLNRKWFATETAGLFLVSGSGDKILEQYTVDNSPLPTNVLASVAADPYSDKVYVGCFNGLYSFDYTDTTANPAGKVGVMPDVARIGVCPMVSITGIPDGEHVEIRDSSGAVVDRVLSIGDTAHWSPVTKAGVYYIYLFGEKVGSVLVVN